MKLRERIMFASEGVIVALAFAWLLALWACIRNLPEPLPTEPTHHYRELPVVDPATIARVK